jgi:hypothetical protein
MARIFVARSKSYNNSKSLYPTCLIEKNAPPAFRPLVRAGCTYFYYDARSPPVPAVPNLRDRTT